MKQYLKGCKPDDAQFDPTSKNKETKRIWNNFKLAKMSQENNG